MLYYFHSEKRSIQVKYLIKEYKMKKGFTLIELLIVISIVAVLSVVVLITLNPVELLRQGRDSTRFSDMASVKSAIAYYLYGTSELAQSNGSSTFCYVYRVGAQATNAGCGGRYGSFTPAQSTFTKTDITGWIPVNLSQVPAGSGGAPLATWPIDPAHPPAGTALNFANQTFYAYVASTTPIGFYEISARLESSKFASSSDTDGGSTSTLYEVGTNLDY